MPRLIDADAFEVFRFTRKSEDFADGVMYVLDKIDDAPTIEAEPVRHGKWEIHGIAEVCDQCRTHMVIEQYDHNDLNYCPNCGAKMDGKEKKE